MSYLSYNTVSVALNCLRDAVPGRIDLYSGLQYLAGLNRYCKKHEVYKVDCKISANKKEIIANIIDVVKLDDERYLKSFKEIVNGKKRHIDQASSSIKSNFFNGSSFDLSKNIKDAVFDYPQKEGYSLLKIQDCNLILDEELYANVHNYLQSETQLVSFAIWLLRNCGDFEAISISSLRDTLKSFYTDKFVDLLIPIHIDESIIKIDLSDSPAKINSKDFYEAKDDMANKQQKKEYSLQKIVYGAPGTGKSFATDVIIHNTYKKSPASEKEHVFRTTFHPDSDYSTFVGCYKPTKENSASYKSKLLNKEELVERLKEYRNLYEETQAQTQFGFDFYESLRFRSDTNEILKQASGKTFDTCIRIGMAIAERNTPKSIDNITYDFVPQSFTQAYIKAWEEKLLAKKKDEEQKATLQPTENSEAKECEAKPVFLVIEEINRGNCAQIFGDLFQLLDRSDDKGKYGMSCYPIKPDTDLGNYIAGELRKFAQKHNINIDATGYKEIINGEEMLLPNNLYIWATMNTSDQSLFPIDSAFKRRWDWEYVPISKGFDRENKKDIEYKIKIGDYDCDWWQFIQAINKEIGETTKSEDKKLGFYFCKADSDGIIDAKKFVGKVIFYLWNDVFKDYETDIFDCLADEGGEPSFEKLYKFENGEIEIDEIKVKAFIEKVCPDIFSKVNSEEKQKEEE